MITHHPGCVAAPFCGCAEAQIVALLSRAEAAEKRAEEAERERDRYKLTWANMLNRAEKAESALSASRAEVARLTTERDEAAACAQRVALGYKADLKAAAERGLAAASEAQDQEIDRLRGVLTSLERQVDGLLRTMAVEIGKVADARRETLRWVLGKVRSALREPETTGGEG